MKKSPRHYAIGLYQATQNLKGKQLDEAVADFVALLVKRRALKYWPAIATIFKRYSYNQQRIKPVTVITAQALTAAEYQKLEKNLETHLDTTIVLTTHVDHDLISGLKLIIDDKVIDSSLRQHLRQLRNHLNQGTL